MHIEVIATGLSFPEGPIILPDGSLVVTEIGAGQLTRVGLDGATSRFAGTGGGPNGAARMPDGSVIVCNNGGFPKERGGPPPERGRLQRVTEGGAVVADLLLDVGGAPLDAPNDCVVDASGGLWFTNPAGFGKLGNVCYLAPDGRATVAADGFLFPNGIGLSASGARLVICESETGNLLGFEVEGPGKLSAPQINGNIGRRSIPDGFAVDSLGRMIVAGFRTKSLFVLDMDDGRPIEVIELPDEGVTNCCFGGPDFRTLFITSSRKGEVLRLEWPVPGLRLNA
ncbi:MAG: SMP-30/gluconolactonase/LRE family protein [Dehalococcoidia bacterium]